jgi:hypothetical protein
MPVGCQSVACRRQLPTRHGGMIAMIWHAGEEVMLQNQHNMHRWLDDSASRGWINTGRRNPATAKHMCHASENQ